MAGYTVDFYMGLTQQIGGYIHRIETYKKWLITKQDAEA
jgi:hypothetical protein